LEKDAITLLKRIRKFSMAQDIRECVAVHIFDFDRISFAIAKGGVGCHLRVSLNVTLLLEASSN
ncbi:hypothetical protein Tco_0042146, partial [Tanacetum coccineum]